MSFDLSEALPSFIVDFDTRYSPRVGSEIVQRLESYGWEEVYDTLCQAWAVTEKSQQVEGCCRFIQYMLVHYETMHSRSAVAFAERLFADEDIKRTTIAKFQFTRKFRVRCAILWDLLSVESFFDRDQFREIEDVIMGMEWLLIKNYLMLSNLPLEGEMDRIIARVLETGNRYLIWGVLDYYGETLDPTIEAYLDQIDEVDDIVVKERLRYHKKKIEIRDRMYDEQRLEYSDEETALLKTNVFPFDNLIFLMQKIDKESSSETADLETITRRMWTGAE